MVGDSASGLASGVAVSGPTWVVRFAFLDRPVQVDFAIGGTGAPCAATSQATWIASKEVDAGDFPAIDFPSPSSDLVAVGATFVPEES